MAVNTCALLCQCREAQTVWFQSWCLNERLVWMLIHSRTIYQLAWSVLRGSRRCSCSSVQTCPWTFSSIQLTFVLPALAETRLGWWKNLEDFPLNNRRQSLCMAMKLMCKYLFYILLAKWGHVKWPNNSKGLFSLLLLLVISSFNGRYQLINCINKSKKGSFSKQG